MPILVTGGAGFIGSNFIHNWLASTDELIVNLDKLTYAGNLSNLTLLKNSPHYVFINNDIANVACVTDVLTKYNIRAVIHFAAESHVDRSIHALDMFVQTNVVGTVKLLEAVRTYWEQLDATAKSNFRFLNVSTDEVFGSLDKTTPAFTEYSRCEPNNPYSASKSAADNFVRAFHHTYGLPVMTSNCSNNYGAYQFPEKLIPLCIHRALSGKSIPIYGDGQHIRDWLYVEDHCNALRCLLKEGMPGERYNIGGKNEKTNLEVVTMICAILDQEKPLNNHHSYSKQIMFTQDRPGHDRRYAIDASKIEHTLGWKPTESFESGIKKTIRWYLDNQDWVNNITNGQYQQWKEKQYV